MHSPRSSVKVAEIKICTESALLLIKSLVRNKLFRLVRKEDALVIPLILLYAPVISTTVQSCGTSSINKEKKFLDKT